MSNPREGLEDVFWALLNSERIYFQSLIGFIENLRVFLKSLIYEYL